MKKILFVNCCIRGRDSRTEKLCRSFLEKLDNKNGYLLDGYPRTLDQAKAFDELTVGSDLAVEKVIALELDFEVLKDRITGRRICKNCEEIYHIKNHPSKVEGVCDKCGGELYQRKDDTVESLQVRLGEYSKSTEPVLAYYEEKGLLTRINADQPIEAVWQDVMNALEK